MTQRQRLKCSSGSTHHTTHNSQQLTKYPCNYYYKIIKNEQHRGHSIAIQLALYTSGGWLVNVLVLVTVLLHDIQIVSVATRNLIRRQKYLPAQPSHHQTVLLPCLNVDKLIHISNATSTSSSSSSEFIAFSVVDEMKRAAEQTMMLFLLSNTTTRQQNDSSRCITILSLARTNSES